MKRLAVLSVVVLLLGVVTTGAFAQQGALIVRGVAEAPAIDGAADDAAWTRAVRYPMAFNQLDALNQVWTDFDDLFASFQLAYVGNTLYGIVYRTDDVTWLQSATAHENDSVELFFSFDDRVTVTQIRSKVGEGFAQLVGGQEPVTAWSEDGTIFEFAIDLSAVGVEIKPGLILPFNIAINDADGPGRKTQLYPFAGNNTSWRDASALGAIVFE